MQERDEPKYHMRLNEFQFGKPAHKTSMSAFIAGLRAQYQLAQMGGKQRFYTIGNTGKVGIIYLIEGSDAAIGVAWVKGEKTLSSLYIWKTFDPDNLADVAIDVPADAAVDKILDQLDKFIKNPKVGVMEATAPIAPIQPGAQPVAPAPAPVADAPVEAPEPAPMKVVPTPDGDIDELASRLVNRGEVVLMGRNAEGEYFIIPGVENRIRLLDKKLNAEVKAKTGTTMEEQYDTLEEEVRAIASGNTKFGKSLIITGMPSAGKTYRVMKVIEDLGLVEGEDYVVKQGSMTDTAFFRVLLEQINGMIVMDDCDSLWKTPNGPNYLKNALDTKRERPVSKDSGRVTNTGGMKPEQRKTWLEAASRILRGEPKIGDLEIFVPELNNDDADHSDQAYENYLAKAQTMIMNRPPNQIDFNGRIIFVSNLDRSELDPAVLTRATHVDLKFTNQEMLDFIYKIRSSIENADMGDTSARSLSEEEVDEVFEFIRFREQTYGFHSPINFRFFQKAFDVKRSSSPSWKERIAKY
jgi:hypothetical protein